MESPESDMVIRREWDGWYGKVEDDGTTRKPHPKPRENELVFDGEIANDYAHGDCFIEGTASGGVKIIHKTEDEFMFESVTEIILEKSDLDRIQELIKNGLV